jgi:lysophospholipase L1-like esterase
VIKLSVQVSYKKQATLGIIGITILLLAIEIIANVWWVTQIHCEFEQNEIFQNFDDVEKRQLCLDFYNLKTSGDELIPNQSTDSITINTLGFRGAEFFTVKPLDTYRIFMVGGSTMFGAGATSDKTTIPGYLQQLLNEKDFGFDIDVINSGIQGADSYAELKLIEQKLVRFSPDLVIIYDGWNDLRANNTPMEVKENWETICKFGKENDFDTIITLQPIAGFGNKVLTKQELKYAHTGEDYTNNPLIESSSIYQDYAKNLSEIKTCTKTFDLRGVFDTETGPIYWDQGHVSDRGNSIVAKSLFNTVFSIVSENYGFSTFETEKSIKKTSSLLYDDREIVVTVELLPSNESEDKKVKISTYDNTNNEDVLNVTYFLAISKNNENLLREYFFAKDGILIFDVFPDDSNQVQIFGEQQYDHNAYVMSNVTPLQVKGPIFSTDGIYAFDTELRTIDNINNWVFNLSGFHSEINIENDITFEETFTENRSSFQTEDLLRKIFSYYKTPILLNEIFN